MRFKRFKLREAEVYVHTSLATFVGAPNRERPRTSVLAVTDNKQLARSCLRLYPDGHDA